MEELGNILFHSFPGGETAWEITKFILLLAIMLAFAALVFISVVAKIMGTGGNRIAYAKCARQIALLAMILGWLLLICSRVWLYLTSSDHVAGSMENFLLELSWMLLSLGVLLTTIYYCVWGVLHKMPVLQATIGILAAAQNCISLASLLFTIRMFSHPALLTAGEPDLLAMASAGWETPLWIATAFTLTLIFALAGAFSSCWLLIMRKWNDFGRDYYNKMTTWCASWAVYAWGTLWLIFLLTAVLEIQNAANDSQFLIDEAIRALLWLLPLLLWMFFRRAKPPLRHSWCLWLALLISFSFLPTYYLYIAIM